MRLAVITALFMLSLYPWSARADARTGPLHLDFRVDAGDTKAALVSGALEAEPFQVMKYKSNQVGGANEVELDMYVRPQADGTVGVELELRETDTDGHIIDWKPAMLGRRGVPLTATIHAGDVTRTVVVTVK